MTLTPSPAPVQQTSFQRNVNHVLRTAGVCVCMIIWSQIQGRDLCVQFFFCSVFLMNNVFVSWPRNHLGINDEPCWKLTGCFAQLSQNKLPHSALRLPRRFSGNKCSVPIYLRVYAAPSAKMHSHNSLKWMKWI